jgi:hypothetical protein
VKAGPFLTFTTPAGWRVKKKTSRTDKPIVMTSFIERFIGVRKLAAAQHYPTVGSTVNAFPAQTAGIAPVRQHSFAGVRVRIRVRPLEFEVDRTTSIMLVAQAIFLAALAISSRMAR